MYIASIFGSLLIPGLLQSGLLPQVLPAILSEFDLDEAEFGIIAGTIAVVASVLGISAAWAVPRWGAFRVFLAGYGLFALGLGAIAHLGYGLQALCMGMLTGWGLAYLHLGNGLAVQVAPDRAATMTNLLHGVNGLGKALGPSLRFVGGWRDSFLVIAGIGAVLGLAGLAGKPRTGRAGHHQEPAKEAPARDALRQPLFWACGALFVPIVGLELVVILWLPKYLERDAGFAPETGAWIAWLAASTILWAECAGRFLAPWMLRKIAPQTLLMGCALGSFSILIGAGLNIWNGWLGTLALVACGLSFSAPWPTWFAMACGYFPEHRGLLSVVSGASTSLAYMLFYLLGGQIATRWGIPWTLCLSPLLGLLIVVGAWGIMRAANKRPPVE